MPSHTRWHSVDVVPSRPRPAKHVLDTIRQGRRSLNISRSTEEEHLLLHCSPQTVAKVAAIFQGQVRLMKFRSKAHLTDLLRSIDSGRIVDTGLTMNCCNEIWMNSGSLYQCGLNSTTRSKFWLLM
jgi:hypothetical protein